MTPKQYYEAHTIEQCREVAVAAGTNLANFKQIALYNGSVSKKLADNLETASEQKMTALEILYPEKFKEAI